MNTYLIILVSGIIILVTSSCSKKAYTEEGIREICDRIDSLLYDVTGEEFDWGSGEAYSYFTAYFSGSEFVFINEKLHYRNGGDSFNRYYIYDNSAVQFLEKKLRYSKDENDKAKKLSSDLTVYITPSGDVIVYDKIVNGQREQLTDEESQWIFNHSKELINIVNERSKILNKE